MKQIIKYFVYISLVLNFYFNASWIYVFNQFDEQIKRTNYFIENFTFGYSILGFNVALVIITLLSFIVLLTKKIFPKSLNTTLMIIQSIFSVLYIWQLL
jgi:hypothetical protein